MVIKVLASGSDGNCYYLSDGITPILIEAGIPVNKMKDKLPCFLTDIAGCIVSHSHKDHSKAIKDLNFLGIPCYGSEYVVGNSGIVIQSLKVYQVGSFLIKPFEVQHDVPTLGFLLLSRETKEKILYVTDTPWLQYSFRNLSYVMIEANYEYEILKENVLHGEVHETVAERTILNHMEINTTINILKSLHLHSVKAIYLLHRSKKNLDIDRALQKIVDNINYCNPIKVI